MNNDNINFIDKLPFEIHLKKGETKTFKFGNDIDQFAISYSPNIQVRTTLRNGNLEKYSDYIIKGQIIHKKKYKTIEFSESDYDTIITLNS